MIATLLKLVPFRDYAYAALAIAMVTFYNVHVHGLEVKYAARQVAAVEVAVKKASDAAVLDANLKISALTKQHAADVADIEANYEKQIQVDDAAHASDLARLRDIAAHGSSNPDAVLSGAGGSGETYYPGGSSFIRLANLSEELAQGLRDARDDLGKCYADRDALTGK